jgi:hypothetical protein
LAFDQLRASVKCSREYAASFLDSDEIETGEAIRVVLKYNKRIFNLALSRGDAAFELGIDVFEAIVEDERLPEKFFSECLPRWRQRLEERRAR